MFSRRLSLSGQLLHLGQDPVGQRGEVVARVQHVGLPAFPLLLPHEVRAGREEGAQALAVQLQDDAAHAEHHPDADHGEVWRDGRSGAIRGARKGRPLRVALTDALEGHVREGAAEVGVQEALEDVERDVGEAGVHVGVDGQDHSVSPHHPAGEDVSLVRRNNSVYVCSGERSADLKVWDALSDNAG